MDGACYGVAKLDIVVADRVAPDYRAVCLFHFVEAAADNLFEDRRVAFFGIADDGERGDGFAAHGVDVAEGVGSGDLPEGERIVDDRCEKIHRLHQRKVVVDQIHPCVVVGAEANEYVRISRQWQAP